MNRIALWLSSAFWLVMMGLLFKVDILPDYIVEDNPGYEAVVRRADTPISRTMAVFDGDTRVGTSETLIDPQPDGSYAVRNITKLTVKMGFVQSRVSAVLSVNLDKDTQLSELFLDVDVGGQRAEVNGRRKGDNLVLDITLAGETFQQVIPYDNSVIASYFNPFPLGARLKIGQSWRTKFLDPLSQRSKAVEIKVVARETIALSLRDGEPPRQYDTYKVVTTWDGKELAAWATEDGLVLKEETPLGYTLVYREDSKDDQP